MSDKTSMESDEFVESSVTSEHEVSSILRHVQS